MQSWELLVQTVVGRGSCWAVTSGGQRVAGSRAPEEGIQPALCAEQRLLEPRHPPFGAPWLLAALSRVTADCCQLAALAPRMCAGW